MIKYRLEQSHIKPKIGDMRVEMRFAHLPVEVFTERDIVSSIWWKRYLVLQEYMRVTEHINTGGAIETIYVKRWIDSHKEVEDGITNFWTQAEYILERFENECN